MGTNVFAFCNFVFVPVRKVLAWMMKSLGWSLRKGLRHIHRLRPEVAPNAGYMAGLLRLEEHLFGQQTVKVG